MPKKRIGNNVTPSSKTKHTPANNWFGNALKSMGLSSLEMIKNISPSMYEFVETNSGNVNELVTELKKNKISAKRISDSINNTPYMKVGKDIINNTLSDLKTGKFINPERQKELDKEMERRMFGGDIDEMFADMEAGFDDINFDDSLDDGNVIIENNNVVNTDGFDNSQVYATLMVSDGIAKQTKANVESSKANIDTMVALSSNQMMMTRELGNNVLGVLGSINDNLSALIEYNNENMTKYIEASLKYYEETSMKKEEEYDSGKDSKKIDASSIFNNSGLNIKEYIKAIKSNASKTYKDSMLGTLVDMMVENPEFITSNPLGLVLPSVLEAMVPTVLTKNLKHLDKTFKSFFPTLMGKIADLSESSNPMLSTFGNLFGIKEERKDSFKLNKFEKGPIPFDGVTKHAIVEIIPTYLRKILSALSGKSEIAYDWNSGRYTTVDSMRFNVFDPLRNEITSQFRYSSIGDELEKYKEMLTTEDQKRLDDLVDNFFVSLERYDGHFDPFNTENGDPFSKVYKDIDSQYGMEMGNFLRSMIKNMDTNAITELNAAKQKAIRSRKDMMQMMEQNPYEYNLFTVGTDMNANDAILNGYKNARQVFNSTNAPIEKKKNNVSDYLLDIKNLLYRGVNVRVMGYGRINYDDLISKPTTQQHTQSATLSTDTTTPSTTTELPLNTRSSNSKKKKKKRERKNRKKNNQQATLATPEEVVSDFEREYREEAGQYTSELSGTHKSVEDITRDMQRFNDLSNRDYMGEPIDPDAETGTGVFASVRRSMNKPARSVAKGIRKVDDLLYSFLFGSGQQTLEVMVQNVGESIVKIRDKIVDDYVQPLADKIFGTKDDEGFSRDGLFSGAQNSIKDFFNSVRHQFSGKGYIDRNGKVIEDKPDEETAVGLVKKTFQTIKNSTAEYLFGKKDEDNPDKNDEGVIKKAKDSIKAGFNTWHELIFGPKFNPDGTKKEAIQSMSEELKEKAPKTMAGAVIGAGAGTVFGSQLGVLTSLFLPGGPISGAIVGSTLGFLGQSEKFQEFLFGKDSEDEKERVEGLISKQTQDFFKENKTAIIGGAAVGTLKTMIFGSGGGLLTSLLGGPITGALLGAGLSILKKSDMVQELLYGKGVEGEEGYKKGIITSLKEKFKTKDGKNKAGMALTGALGGMVTGTTLSQFGIVGATLFGPVSGAVAGLALGIASSSDKFRDFMFGEYDEEKQKREGGLLGRMGNYLNLEVFQPMKLKIQEAGINVNQFLEEKVLDRIVDAIDPFAHQMKLIGETISNKFTEMRDKVADTVHDVIIQPIAENLNKYILDPMKSFANKVFGGIFKIIGTIASAPFTFLSHITTGMTESHKDKAIKKERDDIWSRDNTKGKTGLAGLLNSTLGIGANLRDTVLLYGSKKHREEAINKNAPYLEGREERIKERNEARKSKYDAKREELKNKQDNYKTRQRNARLNDYTDINDDTDENTRRTKKDKKEKDKKQGFFSRMFKGRRDDETEDQDSDVTLATEVDSDNVEEATEQRKRSKKAKKASKKKQQSTPTLATEVDSDNVEETSEDKSAKRSKKAKKASKKKQQSTPTLATDIEDNSKDSGKSTIKQGKTETTSNSTKESSKHDTDIRQSDSEKIPSSVSTPKFRSSVMKNLSDIRDEVKGQLNGVGINISKIRRILVKLLKDDDTSVDGENNTSELTLFDKITYALSSPLRGIAKIITSPFKMLGTVIGGIANAGKSLVNGIKAIPGKILSAGVGIVKGFGNIIGQIGKSMLAIPKVLGQAGIEIIKGSSKIITTGINGLLTIASNILSGAATLVGSTLKAAGNVITGTVNAIGATLAGIPSFIEGTAKAIGTIGSTILTTIGKAGKGIVSILGTVLNTTINIVGKAVKTASDAIVGLASSAVDILSLPFKFIGGVIGKVTGRDKKSKILEGGTLDGIKNPIKVMNATEGNKALHVIIDSAMSALAVKDITETNSKDGSKNYTKSDLLNKIVLGVGAISSAIGAISGILFSMAGGNSKSSDHAENNSNTNDTPTDNNPTFANNENTSDVKTEKSKFKIKNIFKKTTSNKNNGPTLSNASFDNSAEKQKKNAEKKSKIKDAFKNVSRKTASFMMGEREKQEEKERQQNATETSLGLLAQIRDETREHKHNWGSIFGKKGLITAGLLLASPLIFKLLKKLSSGDLLSNIGSTIKGAIKDLFFGMTEGSGSDGVIGNAVEVGNDFKSLFGVGPDSTNEDGSKKNIIQRIGDFIVDDDNEFTDQSEARLTGMRGLAVKGARVLGKAKDAVLGAGKFAKNTITNVGKFGGKIFEKVTGKSVKDVVSGAGSFVGDLFKSGGKKIKETATPILSKITNGIKSSIAKSGVDVLDESGKVIATVGESNLHKFASMCDDALKALSNAMQTVVSKYAKGSSVDDIAKIISKVGKILTPANLIKKSGKFLKVIGKAGTAAVTLAASEGVWAILGSISGASNPENLFQVNSEYVDWKMRAISTAFKAFLYTTAGSVIDIINELVYEILNFNFIHEIAMIVYSILSSKEEVENLQKGKDEFKAEYNTYVEEQFKDAYQEYLDNGGDKSVSYEDWKKTADVEYKSFSDYNNSKNKSIYGKAWDTAKDVGAWTGEKVTQGVDAAKSAASWVGQQFGNLWGNITGSNKKKEETDAIVASNALSINAAIAGASTTASLTADKTGKAISNSWTDAYDKVKKAPGILDSWLGSMFGLTDKDGKSIKLSEAVENNEITKKIANITKIKSDVETSTNNWWIDTAASITKLFTKTMTNMPGKFNVLTNWVDSLFGIEDEETNISTTVKDGIKSIGDTIKNKWNDYKLNTKINEYKSYKNTNVTGGYGTAPTLSNEGGFGEPGSDSKNGFAMYSQKDQRWAANPYFDSKISSAGCGPTAMAMVATSLIGQKYYPAELAKRSAEWNTYTPGVGTNWSFFKKAGDYYGLETDNPSISKLNILDSLKNGRPIILSGRRGNISEDRSPFTKDGHYVVAHGTADSGNKLIINDPRGKAYSKLYQTSDVLNDITNMWTFKNNGGNHPTPETGSNPFTTYAQANNLDATLGNTTGATTDILGIISTFFSEFGTRAFDGLLTGKWNLDWSNVFTSSGGTSDATLSTSSYSSNAYTTPASSLEEELLNKLFEITVAGEGNYDSVNADDNGAYSVGKIQFHGDRAKVYFERLANILSSRNQILANEALKYSQWSNRTLTESEAKTMKDFLNTPAVKEVAEPLQDSYGKELLKDPNMTVAMEMYRSGELKDPRSIVLIADIANTGSNHIKNWRKNYDPVTDVSKELENVRNSLKSEDSYWGSSYNGKNARYYKGWMNRIERTYNKLKDWTPVFAGGGLGDVSDKYNLSKLLTMDKDDTSNYTMLEQGGFGDNYGESYDFTPKTTNVVSVARSNNTSAVDNAVEYVNSAEKANRDNKMNKYMEKIIEVLLTISDSSKSTSDKISNLKSTIKETLSTNIVKPTTNIITGGNNTTQNYQIPTVSKNEQLARLIATGN